MNSGASCHFENEAGHSVTFRIEPIGGGDVVLTAEFEGSRWTTKLVLSALELRLLGDTINQVVPEEEIVGADG